MIEFLMGCCIGALVAGALDRYAGEKGARAAELTDAERRRRDVLQRRAADLGGVRLEREPDMLGQAMAGRGYMIAGTLIGFDDAEGEGPEFDDLDTRR